MTALRASSNGQRIFLIGKTGSIQFEYGSLSVSTDGSDRREEKPYHSPILGKLAVSDHSLRKIFTAIEFFTFYLTKQNQFSLDRSYVESSDTLSERLKFLRDKGLIRNDLFKMIGRIKSTRDSFSHSFIEVKKLTFDGVELRDRDCKFLDVARDVICELEGKFIKLQCHQIDWEIFKIVFDAMRKAADRI